jgi:hypothetical protein
LLGNEFSSAINPAASTNSTSTDHMMAIHVNRLNGDNVRSWSLARNMSNPARFGNLHNGLALTRKSIAAIGYFQRHLSLRANRLKKRVNKRVGQLLRLLQLQNNVSEGVPSTNMSGHVTGQDNNRSIISTTADDVSSMMASDALVAQQRQNSSKIAYTLRHVDLKNAADVYNFFVELLGQDALRYGVDAKPLKVHNPTLTIEIVPRSGQQILNPISEFFTAGNTQAIEHDIGMKDILLTVMAVLDILTRNKEGLPTAMASKLAIRNASDLPPNVLLARAGHAGHYLPKSQKQREQHERQGHQSLKVRDWSMWGIRAHESLVIKKLRHLPEDLLDYLSLEAVLSGSSSNQQSKNRIWRQFEITRTHIDLVLQYFPAQNHTAMMLLRERLHGAVVTFLLESPALFEQAEFAMTDNFYTSFLRLLSPSSNRGS